MAKILLIFLTILMISANLTAQNPPDVLKMVLDTVGFSRADLGYQPKGYWSRFPLDGPYRLTSFDDLFAEPLKLYDYSQTMANAARIYLEPAYLDSNSDALYKLTYALGVDRKLGGFRPYSANLKEVTDSINPIRSAMSELIAYAESDSIYSSYKLRKRPIKLEHDLIRDGEWLDKRFRDYNQVRLLLAKAIINITDIIRSRNYALRNCNIDDINGLYLLASQTDSVLDGNNYYSVIDNIAKDIDLFSMHYAALKAAALAELLADSLVQYEWPEITADMAFGTPYGSIYIAYGSGGKVSTDYKGSGNYLLNIDVRDRESHNIVYDIAAVPGLPLEMKIDAGSDNTYIVTNANNIIASGVLGINIIYDASGNDRYIGKSFTQGAGLFGVGILFDKEGDDVYSAELMAQGAGYFGIGMLIDAAGNDSFYTYGYGQGFGGHGGGIGVLVDYDGDDKYVGEPSPEVYDLADYHSEHKINGNFVQGVGYGRRADLADGHSYAGGVGAIIDIAGNDHYLSGNWSLGTGYWFATGIAYDGAGDDIYESCYFTQGSGAHFCNGILIDEGGNDKHELYETAGAALGFGWDFTNAFLINMGGDDSYKANMISIGCAEVRSNAFLIDIGGDDTYRLKEGALGLGAVDFRDIYTKPSPLHTYFYEAKSFGGFIDIGGQDKYLSFTDSTESDHQSVENNTIWFKPGRADSTYGFDNYGVGIDIEEGIIPEIEKWKK